VAAVTVPAPHLTVSVCVLLADMDAQRLLDPDPYAETVTEIEPVALEVTEYAHTHRPGIVTPPPEQLPPPIDP